MPKLSDTQLVILSAASQRKAGAIYPIPKTVKLNKAALVKVLKSLLKHQFIDERPAAAADEIWRQDASAKFTLVLTEAGNAALEAGAATQTTAAPQKGDLVKAPRTASPMPKRSGAGAKDKAPDGSKLSQLIGLLQRKGGTTLPEAMEVTGWQAHSIRGAISGALKKKRGLNIVTEVTARGRVYRALS